MSIIISTNGKKIKLPKGNNLSEGHITEKPFLGKIQEKNFIKLKELLEPLQELKVVLYKNLKLSQDILF